MAAVFETLRQLLAAPLRVPLAVLRMHAVFSHWRSGWWAVLGFLACLAIGPSAVVTPLDGAGAPRTLTLLHFL